MQEFERPHPENVAVDDRHPLEVPIVGMLRDHGIELRPGVCHALRQQVGEVPDLGGGGVFPPKILEQLVQRRAPDVELVEDLQGVLAGLAALAHVGYLVRLSLNTANNSMAASAASAPRLMMLPPACPRRFASLCPVTCGACPVP